LRQWCRDNPRSKWQPQIATWLLPLSPTPHIW